MSEYRDELQAAKRRIAQLEEELAKLPPPPRSRVPLFFAGFLAAGLASAAVTVMFASRRTALPPPVDVAPPPPVAPSLSVALDVRMGRDPLVVDANHDGVDDVVVPAWHPQTKSLYVVALDGRTFTPLWHAGPWKSQWGSDAVDVVHAGDLVVATDSLGGVHAIDLATGASRGDRQSSDPVHRLCAAADGSPRVVLGSHSDVTTRRILDLAAPPDVEPVKGDLACKSYALPHCSRSKGAYPCLSDAHARGKGAIDPYLTYEDADVLVTTGHAPLVGPDVWARPASYGVAVDRATKKVLWEGALPANREAMRIGTDRMTYADHRIIDEYTALAGDVRVVSRDARSGEETWARTLIASGQGARLSSLAVVRGRLYTTVDTRLHVLDAKTGAPLASVEWMTL